MNVPLWVAVPVVVLVAWAAQADVRTRKIPNRLTFPALLLALAFHAAFGGRASATASLAGLALCLGATIPGWLFKWMGAGDVKLMTAVGAWFAFPQAGIALLASFVAGGVIAVGVALRRGLLTQALRNAALIGAWSFAAPARATPLPPTTGARFPFALAVLAGSTFTLWIRP
jgi:prepilin peptidase CpaA